MEKAAASGAWPPQPPPRMNSWRRVRIVAVITTLTFFATVINRRWLLGSPLHGASQALPIGSSSDTDSDPMNPWDSIIPSTELTWHPCYAAFHPNFRCARLSVPMDYDATASTTAQVHVALLLLLPSTPPSSPSHRSNHCTSTTTTPPPSKQPLLINPGGPGGSGVQLALGAAPALQQILGADRPILGFDPRGIAFTTPRADCWASPSTEAGCHRRGQTALGTHHGDDDDDDDEEKRCEDDANAGLLRRLQWDGMTGVFGSLNESAAALRFLEAGQRGVNDLCRARDGRVGAGRSILRYAGTRYVVRDMVEIVDAWDRWVDREGGESEEGGLRGKLVYWGFSYGTYLGATFARTFPERVGRVVLDGVVDAEFYETPVWKESLLDADKVLGQFFRYCAEAGRRCALYRDGDEANDVRRRYEEVMDTLETHPVTFTHPQHFHPVLLRAYVIKAVVFRVLYSPIQGFPPLAMLLNLLYERQYEVFGQASADGELLCALSGDPAILRALTDAQRSIMCSDKTLPVNLTVSEITAEHEAMAATSQFADIWIGLMMQCNGWDISWHADQKPWPSSLSSATDDTIDTAFPVLFLSTTYDPVTPLRAAVKMALKFKGAGLLEQESQGHCTISTVSRCTARAVRDYVDRGKVPAAPTVGDTQLFTGEWTRCAADEVPWGAGSAGAEQVEVETAEEREMAEGWRQVQRVMDKMKRWGVEEQKGLDMDAIMALAK